LGGKYHRFLQRSVACLYSAIPNSWHQQDAASRSLAPSSSLSELA
jgi:hypothetical protein